MDPVIPLVVPQRPTATNLAEACERVPGKPLSFQYIKDGIARFIRFGPVHLITDEGAAPRRWFEEVRLMFPSVPHFALLVLFCGVHVLGTNGAECLDGCITFLQRFANPIRHNEQYNGSLAVMIARATVQVGDFIEHTRPGERNQELERSDRMWVEIENVTILRDVLTAGLSYPLGP